MELHHYDNETLINILTRCLIERPLKRYVPMVKKELLERMKAHENNTKIFAPYGVTPIMNKKMKDFLILFPKK
jgi:hypothetical protein